jgi:hypothetical protein
MHDYYINISKSIFPQIRDLIIPLIAAIAWNLKKKKQKFREEFLLLLIYIIFSAHFFIAA